MKESSLRNLIESKKNDTIVILSTNWCSKCKILKKRLDVDQIEYFNINLDEYSEDDWDSIGVTSIPTVYYKDTLLVDPPYPIVKSLLE